MDQLLELLDDLGHAEPADPDTITAAALAVRAAATPADERSASIMMAPARTRRNRRRSRRPLALAGAAAVVVAGVAAGTLVSLPGHSSTASAAPVTPVALPFTQGAPGSGAAILNAAANQVLQTPAAAASVPVRYFQTTEWALTLDYNAPNDATPYMRDDVRQTWENPDGSDDVKDFIQDVTRVGTDVGGLQAPPPDMTNVTGHYPPGKWVQDDSLPANVAALRVALTPQGSTSTDPGIPTQAARDMVAEKPSPPLTAAMYQLIAQTPGVFDAGQVTDNDGRNGVAIGFNGTEPGSPAGYSLTEYLVIDPTTGQPLEYEEIAAPGSVLDPALGNGPYVDNYVTLDTSANVGQSGQK